VAKHRKNNPLMDLDLSSHTVVKREDVNKKQINSIPTAIIYVRVSSDKQKNE
jgi:predicted site-specific integrase-resolvase